jgi:hypothetical protein
MNTGGVQAGVAVGRPPPFVAAEAVVITPPTVNEALNAMRGGTACEQLVNSL